MAEENPVTTKDSGENIAEENVESIGSEGGIGSITSPEGVLMLSLAVFFDIAIGICDFFAVTLIGWIIGIIINIFAAIIFGLWVFLIRGQKKVLLKFIIALVIEFIPYVDDVTPVISLIAMLFNIKLPTSWIGFVYTVLNNG